MLVLQLIYSWPNWFNYEYCVVGSGAAATPFIANLLSRGIKNSKIFWQSNNFSVNTFEYQNESAYQVKRMLSDYFMSINGFGPHWMKLKSVSAIYALEDSSTVEIQLLNELHVELTSILRSKVKSVESPIKKYLLKQVDTSGGWASPKLENYLVFDGVVFGSSVFCDKIVMMSGTPTVTQKDKVLDIIKRNQLGVKEVELYSVRYNQTLAENGKIVIVGNSFEASNALRYLYHSKYDPSKVSVIASHYDFKYYNQDRNDFLPVNQLPNPKYPIQLAKLDAPEQVLVDYLKDASVIVFLNTNDQIAFPSELKNTRGESYKGYLDITTFFQDKDHVGGGLSTMEYFRSNRSNQEYIRSLFALGPAFPHNYNRKEVAYDGKGIFKYHPSSLWLIQELAKK